MDFTFFMRVNPPSTAWSKTDARANVGARTHESAHERWRNRACAARNHASVEPTQMSIDPLEIDIPVLEARDFRLQAEDASHGAVAGHSGSDFRLNATPAS
jgi:hypothetical protein